MRSLRPLVALVFVAGGTAACTALLGDFSVSEASADGGSSGTDGSTVGTDGAPTSDSSSADGQTSNDDGGLTDADATIDPEFARLTCVERQSDRIRLASLPMGSNNGDPQFLAFSMPRTANRSSRVRVIAADGNDQIHDVTYDSEGTPNVTERVLSAGDGGPGFSSRIRLLALERYASGVVMLSEEAAVGSPGNVFAIRKLEDDSTAWSPRKVIAQPFLSGCRNGFNVALHVIDAAADNYYILATYQDVGTPDGGCPSGGNGSGPIVIRAARVTNAVATWSSWPVPPQAPTGIEWVEDSFATSGGEVYVLANPRTNGPPNPGTAPFLFKSDRNMGSATTTILPLRQGGADAGEFMLATVMSNGLGAGTASLAFLQAALFNTTSVPTFLVGSVPTSGLTGLRPSADLAATPFVSDAGPSLAEVPIDKGRSHWERFAGTPASENLLAVSRRLNDDKGINFVWWDGKGRVRAKRAGAAGFLADRSVLRADSTFVDRPVALFANLALVWTEANAADASAPVELWASRVGCLP